MNKKVVMGIIGLMGIFGLGLSSVYALTEVVSENHFSTGVVDIELEEFCLNEEGEETYWKNPVPVMPGDHVSKIPRIKNMGNDCYIRARIDFQDAPFNIENIYGMEENWISAKDGYFYFRDSVPTGKTADLFQGIIIPESLDETYADTSFSIRICAEAVQSRNFEPDYSAEYPWGEINIIDCRKEGTYDIWSMKGKEDRIFIIEYEGETEKLVTNEEDFFCNFPVMLPGDIYSDTLTLENTSDDHILLYFRTEAEDAPSLIDEMELKIVKQFNGETETVYEGSLRASELNEGILLGRIKNGEKAELFYELHMPETLDNDYTLLEDKCQWIFYTEKEKTANEKRVSTGDHNLKSIRALCLLSMMSVIGIFLWIRKEKVVKNERKTNNP